MARVLVVGVGPYPTEPGVGVSGPTVRVRLFAEPLADAGHDVFVTLLEPRARRNVRLDGMANAAALAPAEILVAPHVLRAIGTTRLDAVFGVGSLMPLAVAARVARHLAIPCWLDFNGDPLAEYHAAIARNPAGADLILRDHIWKFVREALDTGDRFSTCSTPQRDAVLGQLLLLGRLLNGAAPHRRVIAIPEGVPESWTQQDTATPEFPEALQRRGLDEHTPFVFLGGSWTPWMDEITMGEALAGLLARQNDARLVLRGAAADDAARVVRERFRACFADSLWERAVVDLDPRECDEASLLAHAGATVLLDRDVTESVLGARNRLLPFARFGLVPVVHGFSEVARDFIANDLAVGVPPGDVEATIEALGRLLARDAAERAADIEHGRRFLEDFTFPVVAREAVSWASRPDRWPASLGEGLVTRWARRME